MEILTSLHCVRAKNAHLLGYCLYLRQILTVSSNSLTDTFRGQFAIVIIKYPTAP